MSNAAILDSFANVDALSQPAVVEVKVANLKPGMVLVDPILGSPFVGVDHRVRSARGSGMQRFFMADLENGGWMEMSLSPKAVVKVVAA